MDADRKHPIVHLVGSIPLPCAADRPAAMAVVTCP
jgi:hypothetical protein